MKTKYHQIFSEDSRNLQMYIHTINNNILICIIPLALF